MKKLKTMLGSILVFTLLLVSHAEAATVQYLLDQSNTLNDDVDYLLVTISDNQPGQLDFTVETQSALSDIAGGNFGIASFALNIVSAMDLSGDDFLLPDRWKVQFDKGMSEAGKFDVRLLGTGQTRQDPLQFSILGLELDDIIPGFASHTPGFTGEYGSASSAFFYGDTMVAAIPVPAAFWLFGSGMLLLGSVATRRRI
ncbi:MAG: hypothetical protein PVG72_12540 [Gammaproteobacteria bacterium]|jgi:hypothetical protein